MCNHRENSFWPQRAQGTQRFLTRIDTVFARLAFSVKGILDASICDALLPRSQNPERHGLLCLSRAKNTDFLFFIKNHDKSCTPNKRKHDESCTPNEAQKNSVSLQWGEAAHLVEKNINRRERQERREEVSSCKIKS